MRKILIFIPLLLALAACGKTGAGSEREDIIHIYDSPDSDLPLERAWIGVRGGSATYYIRSKVPFKASWQDSGDHWGSVSAPQQIGDGLWKVELTARPLSERTMEKGVPLYSRRFGVILLTDPSRFLGTYLKVEQGMLVRRYDDFSVLTGADEPNATFGDILIKNWTASQTGLGYTSTALNGSDSTAWVYSKNGYVKLGSDDGYGADFITPAIPALQNDTLLVVAFNAVRQTGEVLPDFQGGTEPITPMRVRRRAGEAPEHVDEGKLTVRVEGGGFIRDVVSENGTSISFDDIPTYDRTSAGYPGNIFDGTRYLVFIEGTEENPLTVKTRIHFETGDMSGGKGTTCSRIFLDDICIYSASVTFDEDIFPIAGRSGIDTVL